MVLLLLVFCSICGRERIRRPDQSYTRPKTRLTPTQHLDTQFSGAKCLINQNNASHPHPSSPPSPHIDIAMSSSACNVAHAEGEVGPSRSPARSHANASPAAPPTTMTTTSISIFPLCYKEDLNASPTVAVTLSSCSHIGAGHVFLGG